MLQNRQGQTDRRNPQQTQGLTEVHCLQVPLVSSMGNLSNTMNSKQHKKGIVTVIIPPFHLVKIGLRCSGTKQKDAITIMPLHFGKNRLIMFRDKTK